MGGGRGGGKAHGNLATRLKRSRLIRSMQNLLAFDRSRSTSSADNSGSANEEGEVRGKRKSKACLYEIHMVCFFSIRGFFSFV